MLIILRFFEINRIVSRTRMCRPRSAVPPTTSHVYECPCTIQHSQRRLNRWPAGRLLTLVGRGKGFNIPPPIRKNQIRYLNSSRRCTACTYLMNFHNLYWSSQFYFRCLVIKTKLMLKEWENHTCKYTILYRFRIFSSFFYLSDMSIFFDLDKLWMVRNGIEKYLELNSKILQIILNVIDLLNQFSQLFIFYHYD